MDKWIDFFEEFLSSRKKAEDFVKECKALKPGDENHVAKIMMHQTQRLISIADDIPQIRRKRESLQLLFLMICAEHISKLHDDFKGEGYSKKYVRQFFDNFLSKSDKNELSKSFISIRVTPRQPLDLPKVVDLLYEVRCDVVHEGNYWGFHFHDGATSMINDNPDIEVLMQFSELRKIVVRGCINAVKDKMKP